MPMPATFSRLFLAATFLPILPAQSVTVPASFANTRGQGGANTLTRDAGNPRTYMAGIAASELVGIPTGAMINGFSFRANVAMNGTTPWPPVDATWASYDIQLGPAIPLANWTGTFAANFAAPPV